MWGSNLDSRLMMEKSDNVQEPSLTLMSQLRKEDPEMFSIRKVALGVTHSAVITYSGELFTAGSKVDGQLG
jgi:alpha-tubulin suppressor-like RCC1 family protein